MLFKSKQIESELFLRKEVLKCAKDGVLSLRVWFNQLENTISIYLIVESLLINAILLTLPITFDVCTGVIDKKYITLLYFINIVTLSISILFTLSAKRLRFVKFERNPKGLYDVLEKQLTEYKNKGKKKDILKDTYMSIILMYQEIFENNKKVNSEKAKLLKKTRLLLITTILLYCGENIILLMGVMMK